MSEAVDAMSTCGMLDAQHPSPSLPALVDSSLLGRMVFALVLKHRGQTTDASQRRGMLDAKHLLIPGQRPPNHLLCRLVFALTSKHRGQITDAGQGGGSSKSIC